VTGATTWDESNEEVSKAMDRIGIPRVITGPEEQIFALTTRILALRSSSGQLVNPSQVLKDGLETG
jgi:hypothetical protein